MSLRKLSTVCMSHRRLILSSEFQKVYNQQEVDGSKQLILHNEDGRFCVVYAHNFDIIETINPPPMLRDCTIVASYNGLLCISKSSSLRDVCVFNPSLRLVKELPKGNENLGIIIGFGLGYIAERNEYQVVRIIKRPSTHLICEVLNLGKSNWQIVYPNFSDVTTTDTFISLPVSVEDKVYWGTLEKPTHGHRFIRILEYDTRTKAFQKTMFPKPDERMLQDRDCLRLLVSDDMKMNLSLFLDEEIFFNSSCEIWMQNNSRWEHVETIHLENAKIAWPFALNRDDTKVIIHVIHHNPFGTCSLVPLFYQQFPQPDENQPGIDRTISGNDRYVDVHKQTLVLIDNHGENGLMQGKKEVQAQKRKLVRDDFNLKEIPEENSLDDSTGVANDSPDMELVKIIESSDVILEVLDARDPLGTRCIHIEKMVMKYGPNKHLVLLLNKIDLIPREAVERWLTYFREELPAVAFKCSTLEQISNLGWKSPLKKSKPSSLLETSDCLGAETLIKLLNNYSRIHENKKLITVGIVGLPNVGKSSLIRSLKKECVINAGSTPGLTQSLQLDDNVKLLDCLGVAMLKSTENDAFLALRNCKRIEDLEHPISPVKEILKLCPARLLVSIYKLPSFDSADDFLKKLAALRGIVEIEAAARIVLHDWNDGKIAYYTMPPARIQEKPSDVKVISNMGKELNIDEVYNGESSFIRSLKSVNEFHDHYGRGRS